MTIYELKILFHYYCSPRDYMGTGEPILNETLNALVSHNLLEVAYNPDCAWKITERGKFYVEYLQTIPLPEEQFYIPKE